MKRDFGILFKKFRLRSEFESLSELSNELLKDNIVYDPSVFSRWQRGERIPTDRKILLILLKIFIRRKGIISLKEANDFFSSANYGYLTEEEINSLPDGLTEYNYFQVPIKIANFIGRSTYLEEIKNLLINGNTVLIHGAAGRGKTSLAIEVGYLLKDHFPDGILWYRLDISSLMNVLASIAFTYGKDISSIQDVESRAAIVRSLLSKKKILLIFDNVEKDTYLEMLFPNSQHSAILLTSRHSELKTSQFYTVVDLPVFNKHESFELLGKILGEKYVELHQSELLEVCSIVGFLPLAVHVLAKQLLKQNMSVQKVLTLMKENISLSIFTYENKDLYIALSVAFNDLDINLQKVFVSLGVFGGVDFSLPAVSFVNDIDYQKAEEYLENLVANSLVERSIKERYRLHPIIKLFIKEKIADDTALYDKAAQYYQYFVSQHKHKSLKYYSIVRTEIENILDILDRCMEMKYWKEVIALGEAIKGFIWETEWWPELEKLVSNIFYAAQKVDDLRIKALCCLEGYSWYYCWSVQFEKAEYYTKIGLSLSKQLKDTFLIAYSYERLGEVYMLQGKFKESLKILQKALSYFKKQDNFIHITQVCIELAELYFWEKNFAKGEFYLLQGLTALESVSDNRFKVIESTRIYCRLGSAYLIQKDYKKATEFYKKSLDFEDQVGARLATRFWSRLGLGLIYEKKGLHQDAKLYFDEANNEAILMGMTKKVGVDKSVFFQLTKEHISESVLYKPFYDYV